MPAAAPYLPRAPRCWAMLGRSAQLALLLTTTRLSLLLTTTPGAGAVLTCPDDGIEYDCDDKRCDGLHRCGSLFSCACLRKRTVTCPTTEQVMKTPYEFRWETWEDKQCTWNCPGSSPDMPKCLLTLEYFRRFEGLEGNPNRLEDKLAALQNWARLCPAGAATNFSRAAPERLGSLSQGDPKKNPGIRGGAEASGQLCKPQQHVDGHWQAMDTSPVSNPWPCCPMHDALATQPCQCGMHHPPFFPMDAGATSYVARGIGFYEKSAHQACECMPEMVTARWVPHQCQLLPWSANHFCSTLGNRSIMFVGDSTMHQVATTLMNAMYPTRCQSQRHRHRARRAPS